MRGVLQSAFGYTGQKCSACSRVIIVNTAYEVFVKRLLEACRSISTSPSHVPGCQLGPVIDKTAYQRLRQLIANPPPEAKLLYTAEASSEGYFIAPTVFEVYDFSHMLMQKELFGPILTLVKTDTFDKAIEGANSTAYALTGAIYSRLPSHLKAAKQRFRVGNLYINRGSTGDLVDRQPFGGFQRSGLGTKAGGPSYLLHFSDPRCITENTMRRGFTPEFQG